jgi:hypothetical protein
MAKDNITPTRFKIKRVIGTDTGSVLYYLGPEFKLSFDMIPCKLGKKIKKHEHYHIVWGPKPAQKVGTWFWIGGLANHLVK